MSNKKNSNRTFGILFFLVFLIVGIWPILDNENTRWWAIVISLIFLLLGIINSKILTPFNLVWYKFGIILGSIVAPIVMGLVFFMVVTPIGIFMKIIGKDLLNLKYNKYKKKINITKKK